MTVSDLSKSQANAGNIWSEIKETFDTLLDSIQGQDVYIIRPDIWI